VVRKKYITSGGERPEAKDQAGRQSSERDAVRDGQLGKDKHMQYEGADETAEKRGKYRRRRTRSTGQLLSGVAKVSPRRKEKASQMN